MVQTFTWESTTRSGTFTFPDIPGQTYRKILMRYNMRCHDAAVGSGNVGCYEWDYSCNTFITDPTRTDSVLANHPTHLISNFSGPTFAYTSEPTYTYFQFEQHDVNYTSVLSETVATVGTGSEPLVLNPLAPGRQQYLFSAAELSAAGLSAGLVQSLRLEVLDGVAELPFLRIRMKHTSSDALDASEPELGGFTQVYFKNSSVSPGEQVFRFYEPFDWDGSSNVLVDLSYQQAPGGIPAAFSLASHSAPGASALQIENPDHNLFFNAAGTVSLDPQGFSSVSQEISIAFWCFGNPDVLPVNTSIMEAHNSANQRQLNIHLPWSNSRVYWDCGAVGGSYDRIEKAANPADFMGKWNHWAFTKNANTGDMKIYLNGQLWHSGSNHTRTIDIQKFILGSSAGLSNFYHGAVDGLEIWNKELEGNLISEWMYRRPDASHPHFANLLASFQMDEGQGSAIDSEGPALSGSLNGVVTWRQQRGENLFQDFEAGSLRPNIQFVQGEYTISDQTVSVLDSVPNPPRMVRSFAVDGTDLVAVDTNFFYSTEDSPIYDESGQQVGTIPVASEGSIDIGNLVYFQKSPAKFEILSLVTPYGNGLDLGPDGATFTIDVTDYAPILRGERFMSIEMGGQFQEELDIQFLYITGTPEREVLEIQNVWPFRRGWIADILSDAVFEPRTVSLNPAADLLLLQAAITGHGQNGEFVSRDHYINVNGGTNEYEFPVWKRCGENPMYPQGGTWLFDRAGWCPGLPTDLHRLNLSFFIPPGSTEAEIDYGIVGPTMSEANYLVSNQLISYGPLTAQLDASIEAVIRPTRQHEYGKLNPACRTPQILVRNTGEFTITQLKIDYSVVGSSNPMTYEYSGILYEGEEIVINLPVPWLGFWYTQADEHIFEVSLREVNGQTDENADNNYMRTYFHQADVYAENNTLQMKLRTNNRASENSYTIRDSGGEIVLSRYSMANATTYIEEIQLPAGCYTFRLEDLGGDGLSYWFWNLTNPSVGVGYIRFEELFNGVAIPVKSFNPEFGSSVQYDFVIGEITSTEELEQARLFSLYPNPASEEVMIELQGFQGDDVRIELFDLQGRTLYRVDVPTYASEKIVEAIPLRSLPAGMYYVRASLGDRVWVKPVVKE